MIGQRPSSYKTSEIRPEEVIEAAYAILNHNQPTNNSSRWICEGCGMIHQRVKPNECDSCGNQALAQQADIHCEMNNHW
jgi:rubrerythrin